jgi:hypothetical protein
VAGPVCSSGERLLCNSRDLPSASRRRRRSRAKKILPDGIAQLILVCWVQPNSQSIPAGEEDGNQRVLLKPLSLESIWGRMKDVGQDAGRLEECHPLEGFPRRQRCVAFLLRPNANWSQYYNEISMVFAWCHSERSEES